MSTSILSPLPRHEVERFLRFAVVGGISTLVDMAMLVVFKEALGLPLLVANALSFGVGILNNFTLNRLWTYPEARDAALGRQFLTFLSISLVGLLLNTVLVQALTGPAEALLGGWDGAYLAAKAVATGVVLCWNFTANRLWTFGAARSA